MSGEESARLISELAADTARLIVAIDAETAALRNRDLTAFADIGQTKTAAVGAWEKRMMAVDRTLGGVRALPPEDRRVVDDLAVRLAAAAEENVRLLRVAVEAGRRTMASVAEAAKALAPGPGIYARDGSRAAPARSGAKTAIAVSFDRSL